MFNRSLRLATQQSRATALHFRTLSTTPRTLFPSSEKPNSEGHATRKADDPIEGGLDVQNAAVRSAQDQAKHGRPDQGGPHDTAAEDKGGVANTTGEKEKAAARAKSDNELAQIGSFKDHRGGISENDKPSGSVGGKEEANAPSITARVKQATGIGASKKDHQESKTGPTTNRGFHTSAWAMEGKKDASKAGLDLHADGEGPRTPVDEGVAGEQNPHLKHKKAGEPDSGKGNAAPTPHLPSHSRAAAQKNTDKESQQKARYHTSARRLAGNPPGGYAAATTPEPAKSGYNVPGQAFPNAELHARPPPPQPGLKPASQLPHSSTGEEPPHPHVNAPVGSKKNPPPGAEAGKAGLDEGYKTRNP